MIIFFAENIMRLVESIILILSRKVFVRDHRYNCCYVYKCISNLILYSHMIAYLYIYRGMYWCVAHDVKEAFLKGAKKRMYYINDPSREACFYPSMLH